MCVKSKVANAHQAVRLAKRSSDESASRAPIGESIVDDEEWMGEYLSHEIVSAVDAIGP